MPSPRRPLLVTAALALTGGCVGDEFDTRDDVPHPLDTDDDDDEELDGETMDRVLSFAEASADTLEEAATAFVAWEADPAAVEIDRIDGLRIDATGHIDTYDAIIAPNLDRIADLDQGTSMNGEEWPADGGALASALDYHEHLLFHVEEASIGITNAGGDPDATPTRALESMEHVLENTESVVAATRQALNGG